jgi:orotidine-5'-phosphate decarboxylase
MHPSNRLIVALDLPKRSEILSMAKALIGKVGMVKVGLEAFIAHGPSLVTELKEMGHEIFLDLKVHDIPRTAAAAALQADQLGASLLTVHAAGGEEMIRAAREAASESLKIVAVTVLTSFDEAGFAQVGYKDDIPTSAVTLAGVALEAGADGVVCSALELERLAPVGGLRVVPGIRPAGAAAGDQKRVVTPGQAVERGATWIVVGRPIVQSPNPIEAAEAIVLELAGA